MSNPVIFRRTREGEIVAFFPSLPGDEEAPDTVCRGFTLTHGECSVDLDRIRSTTEASYSEYLPLLKPMADAGYSDIDIVKRIQDSFHEVRANGGVSPKKEVSVLWKPPHARGGNKNIKRPVGRPRLNKQRAA